MKKIITLFKIELLKLRHQRFPLISLLFTILLTIAAAIFRNRLSHAGGLTMGEANGWQILTFAASWGIQISALLILILSIDLVAEEFSNRTIKNLLTRPISRAHFFLGKILTITFLTVVFLAGIFLTSLITGISLGDMGDLQERGYVIAKWSTLLWNVVAAFFLSFITLCAIGTFGAFIAVILPRAGVAIGSSIFLYLILNIGAQFDEVKYFLFTSFTNFPISTAKGAAYGLAPNWTPQVYWCLGTNFISGLLFICVAVLVLNRKDILS